MAKATRHLSDLQLVLLSAASQRADGVIPVTSRLKGGAAIQFGRKLIGLGLAQECPRHYGAPVWREGCDGVSQALRITAAGLAALGLDDEERADAEEGNASTRGASAPASEVRHGRPAAAPGGVTFPERCGALNSDELAEVPPSPNLAATDATNPKPRSGSKLAMVLALLATKDGAALENLAAATDWLPHTVRAVISRLRSQGHPVETLTCDGRSTRYRMPGSHPASDLMLPAITEG